MTTWLFIDANFLCWRSFHAVGDLSYQEIKTGVVFGFLREIVALQDRFGTDRVAFCFDYGNPKRKQVLECYKQKRHDPHERTEEEERARQHMRLQVDALREKYLQTIGYRNVFWQRGIEADDLIAVLCECVGDDDEAVIVSADSDLYQLLRHNVSIFHPSMGKRPGRIVTMQSFKRDKRIHPRKWWRVKALAGCTSDEVPGIQGVGEKTAVKYLRGELKPDSVACQRIECDEGRALVRLNKQVVRLPYPDTRVPVLRSDEITQEGWESVCSTLGAKALKTLNPLPSRAARKRATFGLR